MQLVHSAENTKKIIKQIILYFFSGIMGGRGFVENEITDFAHEAS